MNADRYNTYLGKGYRFMTFEGLDATVENETLRFSRGDAFNDPLDMHPLIAPYEWGEYVTAGPEFIEGVKDKAFDKVFKSLYVCCFCKEFDTDDSYLMWSHYASKHTQVCFEIDFSIHNDLGSPSEVVYPDDSVKCRDEMTGKPSEELGLYLIATKKKVWKYEKEVRLVIDVRLPVSTGIISSKSNDGKYIDVNFDLRNISKVFFGANSDFEHMVNSVSLFSRKGFKPEFFRMYIDPETLTLKPIKLNI